jgi:hypothetical protein
LLLGYYDGRRELWTGGERQSLCAPNPFRLLQAAELDGGAVALLLESQRDARGRGEDRTVVQVWDGALTTKLGEYEASLSAPTLAASGSWVVFASERGELLVVCA